MLKKLQSINKDGVYSVFDDEFKPFGRVITEIDVSALIDACRPAMPEKGVNYVTSMESLEKCAGFAPMQAYFGSPMQAGCCWGHNVKMDALEYHRASEFNIAVTDMVLFLADRRDIGDDYTLNSGKVKAFYAPKGTLIEVYATTLHYAPCQVTDDGFVCIVILPRGTNEALIAEAATSGEQRLMTARDKWLICCDECEDLVKSGVHAGITGGNRVLNI